jgi:hypothetical protein
MLKDEIVPRYTHMKTLSRNIAEIKTQTQAQSL